MAKTVWWWLGGLIAVTVAVVSTASLHFAGSPTREPISIGVSKKDAALLLWVADDQKFFEEEGVFVNLVPCEEGVDALAELLAGRVDMGTVAHSALAVRSFQRDDFRIVATVHSASNFVKVLARRDRGIHQISDLRGKRVAVHELHSGLYFLNALLLHAKVPFSTKHIQLVSLDVRDFTSALLRGKVDAIAIREPYIYHSAKLLGDRAIVFSADDIYLSTYNLVATLSAVTHRPLVIEKVLRALLKAEKYVFGREHEVLLSLGNKMGLDPDYVDRHWRDSRWFVRLDENLILSMEEDARYVVEQIHRKGTAIPDMTRFVYLDGLAHVARSAVGMLQYSPGRSP